MTQNKSDAELDNEAVDKFAQMMKDKLAKKRGDGYRGWEHKGLCPNEHLSTLLRICVEKGDPVDVANLAMFIGMRGETIRKKDEEHVTHKKRGSTYKVISKEAILQADGWYMDNGDLAIDEEQTEGGKIMTHSKLTTKSLPSGWQMLHSAPQDGSIYLIASTAGTGPTLGRFEDGYHRLLRDRYKVSGDRWRWMPLPPAPEPVQNLHELQADMALQLRGAPTLSLLRSSGQYPTGGTTAT